MNAELKPEFDFGPGSGNGQNGEAQTVDFTGLEPIGKCPKCGGNVYDSGMSYICENAVGPNKKCDFRSGKVILQRNMTKEEMVKLLTTGKTDLLHKFISKKHRPFSAYLVFKEGKTQFEFAARVAKTPKAKTSTKAKASAEPKAPEAKEPQA